MDCFNNFAASITRDLVCGAVHELRYPCCFDNLVEDLQREKDKFVEVRNSVQDRIGHAKKQTKKTDGLVHKWLEEANNGIDNVDELLERARTRKSCCFGQCPNLIWRYCVGKQLAESRRMITNYNKEGRNYPHIERLTSLPGLEYFPSERCSEFESRQHVYEQLMMALEDDEVNMIGLYGMGGCGKSTLAIEVGKRAKKEGLFDEVLLVPVSSTVEVQRIQEVIACSLKCELKEKEEMLRARRLHNRFMIQEEKVLVILDNVWQMLDLVAIGIPSSKSHKRCKILITTRSEGVCIGMDCQKRILLSLLTDEEAWDLFQNQAHISETTHDDLKHLAREISNNCEGLPIAITAVASTLKGKTEVEWKVAYDRLTSSDAKPVDIEKGFQNPYKCLQLSYDNLDMEEAKSLLLLCSVFPEEYEIPLEDLTRLAIGLGLIGEVHSYDRARNVVCAAKAKLIRSCLLWDVGEGKCVKIHGLIRQVAMRNAKDEGKELKCVLEKDVTVEYTLLSYLWCEKFPYQLDCSNLEFLCINTYLEALDEIFNGMKKLRVLFLINKGLEIRPLLTNSFKSLTNLRCLLLQNWKLGGISFLGDLKKLESLTLHECSFLELHDVVVTQLSNLRLLDLSECEMEMTPFEVIGRQPQLEELYINDGRSEWDMYDETTARFFSIFSVPKALQRCHIRVGTRFSGYENKLLNRRKILILSCFDTSNAAVKELAEKAEVLHIAKIQGGAKNIIPDIFQINGRGMNELIELWISASDDIEHLVDNTGNHLSQVGTLFSKLCKLKLEGMEHLRSLYHGQPPCGLTEKLEELYIEDCPELLGTLFRWKLNLCSLKVLELDRCPKLISIFTPAVARSLVQLEKLKILYCDELMHILADDNKEEISTDDPMLVFPKLKQLTVRGCNKVEYIIPVTYAQGLLQLECLEVEANPELRYVFGPDNHQSQNELKIELPLLVKLTLVNLPNIIGMCPRNCYPECPSLCQFTLRNCPEVAIVSINTCISRDHSTIEIGKNCSLKGVGAIKNHELASMFELELNGRREFSEHQHVMSLHLESNQLEDFPEITSISSAPFVNYNSGPFTLYNLKRLILRSCWMLRTLFSPATALHLTSLEELIISECHELRYLVAYGSAHETKEEIVHYDSQRNVSMLPRLERFSVENCSSLEYIFHVSHAQGLVKLKEIEIRQTPCLIYVFGHSIHDNDDAHSSLQYQKKIQIELPILKTLTLFSIPDMINICPDNYTVTCSSLGRIVIDEVRLSTLSINNLMLHSNLSSTLEIEAASMTNVQLLGSVAISNSMIKGIFHLDELPINGPQATSWLIDLNLVNLPELNYIWTGAKHSVTLQNLQLLCICGCEKLKTIFSSSISRSLPQLKILVVLRCEGLEQIIEDDEEQHESVSNHQSQKVCFLKLKLLLVAHCNNLKRLFYLSTSHEFPELEYLIINQDFHLEQVFEGVREVLLPKLKHVILMQLPNLINVSQGIEQNLTNLLVHNCPKLSLTSTTTVEDMLQRYYHDREIDFIVRCDLLYIRDIVNKETTKKDPMLQTTSQHELNPEDQTTSEIQHNQIESGANQSHEVLNRGTQDSQSLEHKLSSHNLTEGIKETEIATTGKVPVLVKTAVSTRDLGLNKESTTSLLTTFHKIPWRNLVDQQTTNEPSFLDQRQELGETKGIRSIIKENAQEGSTSKNAMKAALSARIEGNDFDVVVATHTNFIDEDMLAQHSQLVEQGDKLNENEIGTTPCQKNKNVDDGIQEGSNLIGKEGEICAVSNDSIKVPTELGAYKHFIGMDAARIALLKEAITVYPHLWNVIEKFSESLQPLMLQTLADMLLFLRNESAISVTPQRVKEFHILCDMTVLLGFEKSWVDTMRQRVTVRDPKVDLAQEQLSELLKRRDQLTQELLMINDEIDKLNDFITAQKKCFYFL